MDGGDEAPVRTRGTACAMRETHDGDVLPVRYRVSNRFTLQRPQEATMIAWRRTPAAAAAAIALLAVACGEPSSVVVRLHADRDTPDEMDGVTVWLREDGRTRRYGRAEGRPLGEAAGWRTPVVGVGDGGSLVVLVELVDDSTGRSLQGHVDIQLRDGFEWGVDVFRRPENPTEACLGCAGVDSVPLPEAVQNEPGEKLWITWGGRERGSDVVF